MTELNLTSKARDFVMDVIDCGSGDDVYEIRSSDGGLELSWEGITSSLGRFGTSVHQGNKLTHYNTGQGFD